MRKWSVGFYTGFDTLVKVAKDKFHGVDLSNLKAEDYTDHAGNEAGSPMSEEEGQVPSEAIWEEGSSSQLAVVALPTNSPSPVPEISLVDPLLNQLRVLLIEMLLGGSG